MSNHLAGAPPELVASYQRLQLAEEATQAAATLLADALVDQPWDKGLASWLRLNYIRARTLARDSLDEYDDLYEHWWSTRLLTAG